MGPNAMSAIWAIVILVVLAAWASMSPMAVVKKALLDWFERAFSNPIDRKIR
jgi:hypothetical protein